MNTKRADAVVMAEGGDLGIMGHLKIPTITTSVRQMLQAHASLYAVGERGVLVSVETLACERCHGWLGFKRRQMWCPSPCLSQREICPEGIDARCELGDSHWPSLSVGPLLSL